MVVGRRGEIYTTRRLRESVGLKPGGKASVRVQNGALVVKPKPTALDLLSQPRVKAPPLPPHDPSRWRRTLAAELEAR